MFPHYITNDHKWYNNVHTYILDSYQLTSFLASMSAFVLINILTTSFCPASAAASNGVYCLCKRTLSKLIETAYRYNQVKSDYKANGLGGKSVVVVMLIIHLS